LPVEIALIGLPTLVSRATLLVLLSLQIPLTLQLGLTFLIPSASVFLLAAIKFSTALFILLPAGVCLALLVGGALLVLPLTFRLALLVLRLPLTVPTLFFGLATLLLLIIVVALRLVLILRLLLVISFVTTSPVILSAHEDGRAQAERHNQ
jgi:hypothetical protein